jgi:anti-repressor protein
MNELTLFNHDQFGQIRTITDAHGEPWFVAADIAKALGYSNTSEAISRHCKGVVKHDTYEQRVSGSQAINIIPESDLYRLIMRSNLPDAERFQDWVCDDILPSIRKHGAYMTPEKVEEALLNPDTIIKLATNLKTEQELRRKAEAERAILEKNVRKMEPAKRFYDAVGNTRTNLKIRQYAKLINNAGINVGEKRLFAWLRERGYLMKNNEPIQTYVDSGIFTTKEVVLEHMDTVKTTTLITPKGQQYLFERWCKYHKLEGYELLEPELVGNYT